MYEKMTDMGYLFYCILARLVDLKPEIIKKGKHFWVFSVQDLRRGIKPRVLISLCVGVAA